MAQATYTVLVPEPKDKGYVKFLKRVLRVQGAINADQMSLSDWEAVEVFLSDCLQYDGDKTELIESWSLDDLQSVFAQIMGAVDPNGQS